MVLHQRLTKICLIIKVVVVPRVEPLLKNSMWTMTIRAAREPSPAEIV
jgi:hypothetical protein